ncbi:YlxR family protein [Arthrobacter sp. H5]|uniref:YlxR family protein n=1 Tax=Arthrobacter sp. H5 TaxID=1267973 RepID=UPI000687D79B|nr:YlxR family protein [Arthrobacter sp. H5]
MSLRPYPVRTCIGCRVRDDRAVLQRVVGVEDDGITVVVLDEHCRLAGRGAWLHPEPSCVELALKRKAFNRAFRGAVVVRNVEAWQNTLKETSATEAT